MTERIAARACQPSHSGTCPRWPVLLALSIALVFGGTGGCAALGVATLASVVEAAGSAEPAAREVFSMGKIDTAADVPDVYVLLAARAAARDLRLSPQPDPLERGVKDLTVREISFVDDKGGRIRVHLERRSERFTLVHIDVGIFGSEPFARHFLRRLRAHLPGPGLSKVGGPVARFDARTAP